MRFAQPLLQLLAVFGKVHRILRHAGVHGRLGDGRRFPHQHARIERLGDDVVDAKLQALDAVGPADGVGHIFLGQRRQGMGGCQLHLFVDGGGAHVERAAEDEGEAQNVVDLVGIVGAARSP